MKKKLIIAMLVAAIIGSMAGCAKDDNSTKAPKDADVASSSGESNITENAEPTEVQYPTVNSDLSVKNYGSVVTVGDTAYELYSYVDDTANSYAKSVNRVADSLSGKSNVYEIVIPLSSGITFPDNLKDQIKSSDQKNAIDSIKAKASGNVKFVDIYGDLMAHRNEYIYFRADHHWTALGAYYAYNTFCKESGKTANALNSYETKEFTGFLGSFYNDTKKAAELEANPDTLTAYCPKSNAVCHVTPSSGQKYDWPVVYDVSKYSSSLKYSAFIAADNPYTVIENKDITDNSVCVVVKESFGNAFIPFLVDHYKTIYVVDYRYWTGSVSKLAEENNADDVIFLNNLSMIRSKYLVGKLNQVV